MLATDINRLWTWLWYQRLWTPCLAVEFAYMIVRDKMFKNFLLEIVWTVPVLFTLSEQNSTVLLYFYFYTPPPHTHTHTHTRAHTHKHHQRTKNRIWKVNRQVNDYECSNYKSLYMVKKWIMKVLIVTKVLDFYLIQVRGSLCRFSITFSKASCDYRLLWTPHAECVT